MLKKILILLAFILAYSANAQEPLKITFIGNSLTYTHDLPGLLQKLVSSAGDTITVDSYAPGGWTFYKHAHSEETSSMIHQSESDYIVIQGNSKDACFYWWRENMMYPSVRKLVSEIRENNAIPVLYLTYANWGGGEKCLFEFGAKFCSMPFEGYYEMQDTITAGYRQIAQELDVMVAPAGVAFKNTLLGGKMSGLWLPDNVHPTDKGAYLTACVFYATLFDKSPVGLGYHFTLTDAEATYLQEIAEKTVLEFQGMKQPDKP